MKLRQKAIKHRMAGHRDPPVLRAGTLGHLTPIKQPKRVTRAILREWLTSDTRTLTIGHNSLWRDNLSIYLLRGGKQWCFRTETEVWDFYFKGVKF